MPRRKGASSGLKTPGTTSSNPHTPRPSTSRTSASTKGTAGKRSSRKDKAGSGGSGKKTSGKRGVKKNTTIQGVGSKRAGGPSTSGTVGKTSKKTSSQPRVKRKKTSGKGTSTKKTCSKSSSHKVDTGKSAPTPSTSGTGQKSTKRKQSSDVFIEPPAKRSRGLSSSSQLGEGNAKKKTSTTRCPISAKKKTSIPKGSPVPSTSSSVICMGRTEANPATVRPVNVGRPSHVPGSVNGLVYNPAIADSRYGGSPQAHSTLDIGSAYENSYTLTLPISQPQTSEYASSLDDANNERGKGNDNADSDLESELPDVLKLSPEEMKYPQENSVVWVKFQRFPFWPSVVRKVLKLKKRIRKIKVVFLGEGPRSVLVSYSKKNVIYPFSGPHYQKLVDEGRDRLNKNEVFMKTFNDALHLAYQHLNAQMSKSLLLTELEPKDARKTVDAPVEATADASPEVGKAHSKKAPSKKSKTSQQKPPLQRKMTLLTKPTTSRQASKNKVSKTTSTAVQTHSKTAPSKKSKTSQQKPPLQRKMTLLTKPTTSRQASKNKVSKTTSTAVQTHSKTAPSKKSKTSQQKPPLQRKMTLLTKPTTSRQASKGKVSKTTSTAVQEKRKRAMMLRRQQMLDKLDANKAARKKRNIPIVNFIMSEAAAVYLREIFNGRIHSERHRQFLDDIRERDKLKYAGFGPIDDDDQQQDILQHLTKIWKQCSGKVGLETYVLDVWVPEVVVLSLQKIRKQSAKKAWDTFRKGVPLMQVEREMIHEEVAANVKRIKAADTSA